MILNETFYSNFQTLVLVPGKQTGWTFSFHSTGTWSLMMAISLMPIPWWFQLGCLIIFSACKRCSFLESTTTVFWSPATNKEGVAWSRQWAAVTTYERWIYKDTQTYTSLQFSSEKWRKTIIKDLALEWLFLSICDSFLRLMKITQIMVKRT